MIAVFQYRHSVLIDMKGKGRELFVSHVHWPDLTDIWSLLVLADDKDGLSLVFQLSTDVSSGVVVVLVQVQDTMDMQIVQARPSHEHGNDIRRFLGIVDDRQ